ncbi:MAG: hypothetical protein GY761_00440 [Hyphomicrobiales bacterium]|nr:hypothetical protein [Hyphomicrobiales bacterium]
MPLEIFALITPLGIALIVLIIRYSGLSKTARIKDRNNAIEIFHRDFAGENVSDTTIISVDQSVAFIEMEKSGQLGFVEAIQDRFITRLLGSKDIASFEQCEENSLSVTFHDFTHPKGRYEFYSSTELSRLVEQLTKLEKQQ